MDLRSYEARLRAILDAAVRPGMDYPEGFAEDVAACHHLRMTLLQAAGLLVARMVGELPDGLPLQTWFFLQRTPGAGRVIPIGEYESRDAAYRVACNTGPGEYIVGLVGSPADEKVSVTYDRRVKVLRLTPVWSFPEL